MPSLIHIKKIVLVCAMFIGFCVVFGFGNAVTTLRTE